MRALILHSDVAHDAPPDEQDTLLAAAAVGNALREQGYRTVEASFIPEPATLKAILNSAEADVVFNLVESVHGDGLLASLAPAMLERFGVRYTGSGAACLALTADKCLTKALLRGIGLSTPDWVEGPRWEGLSADKKYIVKSVTEDASLGLDGEAVVVGCDVAARARHSHEQHGGRWFAEAYLDGREFNVALLEDESGVRILPIAEMRFDAWDESRPRIVGYAAKWDEASQEASKTVRAFAIEEQEPDLARALQESSMKAWNAFRLRGYARIDFRTDADGTPMILEVNPNPCLEPNAGFAAAAARAGISYPALVEHIVRVAYRG